MFLVCGEALFDVFIPPDAGADGSLAMQGVPGGSPFNVAIGLARLEVPVAFLAGLSRDALGERLEQRLSQEGVRTNYLVRRPERTTLSLVSLGRDGVPTYSFYGDRSADTSLAVADLPEIGPDVTGLHLGSYSIVVPPVAEALAVLALRARSKLITLDLNVRLGVVPDPNTWVTRIEGLLPHVSVLKASDEDLALLWPGRAPEELAGDWLSRGPKLVVITRGPGGASAFQNGRQLDVPAPAVSVIDTVGAGDAFQTALIEGLLTSGVRGPDDVAALGADAVRDVIDRCVSAGAIACTRRGANPPRKGDLRPLRRWSEE